MSDATTTTDETQDDQTTETRETRTDDTAGLRSALDKEREARKSAEKAARDFESRLKKIEDRDKTELQKAQDRAADLETKYGAVLTEVQQERAERLVTAASVKANAVRPDAIYRLIRESLAFEAGRPTNVDAAVADARKEYPELFRATAGSGDGGKSGETKQDPNALLNSFIRTGR